MLDKRIPAIILITLGVVAGLILTGCTTTISETTSSTVSTSVAPLNRLDLIPSTSSKVTPETDVYPPILYSEKYEKPVPLGSGVNTAGAEDSPFVTPDGNTLYFFFTPDPNIPVEKQLTDGVTGVYISHKVDGVWQPAERVILQDEGKLSMDGAVCVLGNTMWFASARPGNYRPVDIWTAECKDGRWQNWQNAGPKLNADFQIGEMHVTADGNEIYFHRASSRSPADYDIWLTRKVNGEWQPPENVSAVNTEETEGWPFITQDGNELWFLRTYRGTPAIFVSKNISGQWSVPEMVISQFAGEPSLDNEGNIYFVHHYYKNGKMIEADIYVANRK